MSSHQDCYISKPSKTRQKSSFRLQKDPGIQREDKICQMVHTIVTRTREKCFYKQVCRSFYSENLTVIVMCLAKGKLSLNLYVLMV